MTFIFESKVLEGDDPFFEVYQDIKTSVFYCAHGRQYLKLIKNNSNLEYDFCIDLSNIRSFIIEN